MSVDPSISHAREPVERHGIDDAVVELLYANARTGEIITATVATILAVTQWPSLGGLRAGGRLTGMLVIVALRGALRRAYRECARARRAPATVCRGDAHSRPARWPRVSCGASPAYCS